MKRLAPLLLLAGCDSTPIGRPSWFPKLPPGLFEPGILPPGWEGTAAACIGAWAALFVLAIVLGVSGAHRRRKGCLEAFSMVALLGVYIAVKSNQ